MRWILHHNYTVTRLWQCSRSWQKNKMHSCYSHCIVFTRPDTLWLLALCGLKTGLQGQCFATLKDTKCIGTAGLHTILKEAFHECFKICQTTAANVCVCVCVCVHMHACMQTQDILQEQLDWKTLCFKCLSIITEFQELFETPMHDSEEKQWLFPLTALTNCCLWLRCSVFMIYELILNYYVHKFQASKGLHSNCCSLSGPLVYSWVPKEGNHKKKWVIHLGHSMPCH